MPLLEILVSTSGQLSNGIGISSARIEEQLEHVAHS